MKIAVIGAGMVGSTAAFSMMQMQLGEIIMIDVVEGLAEGKALDIVEATPLNNVDVRVNGSSDISAIAGSDVVVITCGKPRQPGMSRMDLLEQNATIVEDVSKRIAALAPECIILVVTNPLDIMCYVAWKTTGFPRERVIGQAGVLDSIRFRWFVAEALGVSVADVQAMVLGGHGDSMVPLPRYTTVSGIPITQLMDDATMSKLIDRTRRGGTEIVQLLKTGSAFYAPGAAVAMMVEAIVRDKKRILPASVYLNGEYGIKGTFVGVPIKLGRGGVESIIEIELTDEELTALHRSAEDVRRGITAWEESR